MTEVVNQTGGIEIGGTTLYGMDAEHALKQAAKYDYGRERDIIKWIEKVLDEKLPSKDLHESLKSGILLCRLINKIKPGMVRKYNTRAIALMEIENIKLYLEGCWKLGVPSSCLFVSSDLYKARGMNEVLNNLESLSKIAARLKSYSGPILAIHERDRTGDYSKPAPKRATKKWDTIEIGKPKHINEKISHEDIDIRSENLKLKQQLEREKYDRLSIEEELEELKKSKSNSTVSKSSGNDNNQWKSKVDELLGTINSLEKELSNLKAKSSSSKQSNVIENEIKQLKKQLEDEKNSYQTLKRELQKKDETIKKLENEISLLKNKSSSIKSLLPSSKKHSSSSDLAVSNLKEENEMLKQLINQLRTDLDLAVQLSKTQEKDIKGKKHGPNYFIIDDTDSKASAEIKKVEDCLKGILYSEEVEFSDVTELNQFFKEDSGRRKFTQILEGLMQEVSDLVLSENSFELLLYLINTTLTEMDTSDSSDLITAKILMRASTIVHRETDGQSIQPFICSYSVYHNMQFWEELFWDELFKSHKHRKRAGIEQEDDIYILDHSLTIKVVKNLIIVMLHWNSFKDEIRRFVDNIFLQTKTPEEFTTPLITSMKSDSFWSSSKSKKMKHGTWNAKKLKSGSRVKPKTGSRLGSRLDRKSNKKTEPKEKEKTIVSPRKVKEVKQPETKEDKKKEEKPNKMKDRISQWEN